MPNSGPLCKKSIGGCSGSAIHPLWRHYSPDIAQQVITELQAITTIILCRIGFSISIADCVSTGDDIVKQALGKALIECEVINASGKDIDDKEREINSALNGAMGVAPILAKTKMNKKDRNTLVIMKKSGAKGSDTNNGQIAAFVGQQNIDGKRLAFDISGGLRTLPHFWYGDNSPAARGFVSHSYIEGLMPTEAFHHAKGGRRGVIDTALKTADSGYIEKKIVKKMEDLKTFADGTVRDASGYILQFMYGGDGFEAKHMINVGGLDFPFFVNTKLVADILNSQYEQQILEEKSRSKEKDFAEDISSNTDFPRKSGIQIRRHLKKEEIDLLVSFITAGCPGVQTEVTERVTYNVKLGLRATMTNVKLYEAQIPKFCQVIKDNFETAKSKDGYAAGLVAACSIGEPTTQLTLNTFHLAGNSTKDVTLGVPRLQELLHATKKPSKPTCTIYVKDEFLEKSSKKKVLWQDKMAKACEEDKLKIKAKIDKIDEECLIAINELANPITRLYADYFIDECELRYLNLDPNQTEQKMSPLNIITYEEYEPSWWALLSEKLDAGPKFEPIAWVIILKLNMEKLFRFGITPEDIASKIEENSYGTRGYAMTCVPSPMIIGQIEVYLNFAEITPYTLSKAELPTGETEKSLITESNIDYFTAREVAVDWIKKTNIQGVIGIHKTFVSNENGEWVIGTQGTNLLGLLAIPYVDATRTTSDDMWEIYKVLGIEAARKFLIKEVTKILSFDGTYINQRHISLLVDAMCRTGIITSNSRDGISRDVGPSAKGMFEKSVNNFREAAVFSEYDTMKGVSAAIMFGTLPEIGTGTVEIKDAERLTASRKKNSVNKRPSVHIPVKPRK